MESQSNGSPATSELCGEIARLHRVIYSLAEQVYGWYERQYVQNFLDKLRSRKMEICKECRLADGHHHWQCPERPTWGEGDACERCGRVSGHYFQCPTGIISIDVPMYVQPDTELSAETMKKIKLSAETMKKIKEEVEEVFMGPKCIYGPYGGGEVKVYTNYPDMKKRGKAGNKYIRTIYPKWPDSGQAPIQIDIYRVLAAYEVTNPAVAHAVKKLLCAGLRGKADCMTDLKEALESIEEAIVVHQQHLDSLPKPTANVNYP